MVSRCLNIDWLELYCLEPANEPARDADFFEAAGWIVRRRDYGTRVYDQMFTLLQQGCMEPLIEVRRCPVGNKGIKCIIDPLSCHIRLHNRTCYFDNAAELMFKFLMLYKYTIVRISRIDLCLDFEYFDSGDNPKAFIDRYMKHRYVKINQGNIRAIGQDRWEGMVFNSLAWGAPKSMISTKLYCKSLELQQVKDKPYIRQAWALAGLVTDFIKLTKIGDDGNEYKPIIWRLEFSIKSSVKGWFVVEDAMTSPTSKRSVKNTIDQYFSKAQMLNIFASLCEHYFHFRKYKEGVRKDRCERKVLWSFDKEQTEFYTVERVATATPTNRLDDALRKKLEDYKLTHPKPEITSACDTLISDLEKNHLHYMAAMPWDSTELTLLRQLLSCRIQNPEKPVAQTLDELKAFMTVEKDLFGETDK